VEPDRKSASAPARSRTGAHAKRKPKRRLGGLSTRTLLVIVVSMTLVVMLLGGLVVALKLKPAKTQPNYTATKLDFWQRAVKENPNDPSNWDQLGVAYLTYQRTDDAEGAFRQALALNESDPGANLQLALLIKDTDPKQAQKMLKLSAAMSPVDFKVVPLVALGDLYYSQGEYKEATGAYSQAVGADPSIFEARMGLGRALQARGKAKDALAQYKQALRVNPGSQEAKAAIAGIGDKIPVLPTPGATPSP